MVSFVCDGCGETLKKAKLPRHNCSSDSFSCIDCTRTFSYDQASRHFSCISEEQRHQGSDFRGNNASHQKPTPSEIPPSKKSKNSTNKGSSLDAQQIVQLESTPKSSGDKATVKKEKKKDKEKEKTKKQQEELPQSLEQKLQAYLKTGDISLRKLRKFLKKECNATQEDISEALWKIEKRIVISNVE